MKPISSIEGIIYRIFDSNAADKVICVLDTDGNRKSLLAKGAKKQKSRKSHSIDLGNHVKVKIVEGYNVPIISEIKLVSENNIWKSDLTCLIGLQTLCEIIDKFAIEENNDPRIYKIFEGVLGLEEINNLELTLSIFILQILLVSGHLPKLNECIETGIAISSETALYKPGVVGYTSLENNATKVDPRLFKTQRFIEKSGLYSSLRIGLNHEESLKLLKLHMDWLETTIEKELKSKRILFETLSIR